MFQYAFEDIGVQTAFACFALAGIPIILAGLYGVRYGIEACLRVYFFYMLISFAIDAIYATDKFIFHHTCDEIPKIMAEQGRAWACGMGRLFDALSFFVWMAIPAYLIFIVFSYLEDMSEGGAGPDLSDLTTIGKRKRQPHGSADPYSSVLGQSGWIDGEYGATFGHGRPHASGLGGAKPIMGGQYHEMEYPPPASSVHHYSKHFTM